MTKWRGISGKHAGFLQQDTAEDDGRHADEVGGGSHPPGVMEQRPAINPIMGSLAEQGIRWLVMMVILRSRSFSWSGRP